MNDSITTYLETNLRNDIHFKYVFAKDDPLNRKLLKRMLEVYLEREIQNLIVKSEEVKANMTVSLQPVFDILVEFGGGHKVDVEMQVVNQKKHLGARAQYYLSNIAAGQIVRGDRYEHMNDSYVLFFLDYIHYRDEKLIHRFSMRTEDGRPFDSHLFSNIITVEIPKIHFRETMDDAQLWTYMLKCSGSNDMSLSESIREMVDRREELSMLVECVKRIPKDDKEWLEEFNQRRAEIELAQREADRKREVREEVRAEARAEGLAEGKAAGLAEGKEAGREQGMTEVIRKLSCKMDVSEICALLDLDAGYVNRLLEKKENEE
ncbi:MAG: Rpn family recombination-promoting nuclease/putative transposase [Erysipelotrichaceae bacterium]|nr:Rpn family recombination-promoting nuclease/putative transposase [Erysipelotrichaceae bacterium]